MGMKIYTNYLVKGHSDFKVKCLTFGLYTQVSDSGPLGPLVMWWARHCQASYPVHGQVVFNTKYKSGADKSIARTPGTSSKLSRVSTISSLTPGSTSKRNFQKFGEIYSRVYKRTAAPIFAYVIIMIFSPLASQFANCNPPVNLATFVY